ncbi:MAG: 4'-phosphopantetheinyl transferase superfamily protein [Cyanobacteria bacterium J06631_9]
METSDKDVLAKGLDNVVEVWQISLQVSEDVQHRYWQCLSADEQTRANRFRFADDKRKFTIARGTLRYLLSQQLRCPPKDIDFCYGPYGKPGLEQNAAGLGANSCDFHFNISHSGELALCALGGDRRVGIDIEKLKPMQRLDNMMERCLSAQEQAEVMSTAQPAEAFLQRWTCKEAYLKAIGLGLSQSMKTVEVDIAKSRLLCVPKDHAAGWTLHLVDVPKGYVGALVTAGDVPTQFGEWQHVGL